MTTPSKTLQPSNFASVTSFHINYLEDSGKKEKYISLPSTVKENGLVGSIPPKRKQSVKTHKANSEEITIKKPRS
eukprot:15247644-Ditylum_brightwellii.AAC.1